MKILVTGTAGFIGSHLTDRLLKERHEIIGIDNFNNYYDPKIKEQNLKSAFRLKFFKLYKADICDFKSLSNIFQKEKPQKIVHLAARAGVRSFIKNPQLYTQVNVLGTVNLLKLAVDSNVEQFIFGSSSSVYGQSKQFPFFENDSCNNIISPYGASKRAAEFFVESFYKTYRLKSTILRFFTVYGPRGRPDMAPALFSKAILEGKSINQFGDGLSSRDYTYIDDIVDGILKSLEKIYDFEIINLGNNHPIKLSDFIRTLEKVIGKKAKVNKLPMQPGDVEKTWANIEKAKKFLNWEPKIDLNLGLIKFINWYQIYRRS
ncbi:epimerase [Candidatus Curtissbacteria bacterium RBG_13_35_7]|uniref:Epimerase n=1 Tax=Candidatus Curtissbacteria bacterium RBG_13_35_7 TaxID=1797705 RepID=A0A1F5G4U4_9BACT|nr:MAG: epimerase [Candidatus Curtissbacteria bacterium RBG_13_35_7]